MNIGGLSALNKTALIKTHDSLSSEKKSDGKLTTTNDSQKWQILFHGNKPAELKLKYQNDLKKQYHSFMHGIPKEKIGLLNSDLVCSLDAFDAKQALNKARVGVDKFISENSIEQKTNIFQQSSSGNYPIKDMKGYIPYNKDNKEQEMRIATDYVQTGLQNQPIINKLLSSLQSQADKQGFSNDFAIKFPPSEGKNPERLVQKWELEGTHPASVMDLSRGSIITSMDEIEPMLNLLIKEVKNSELEIAAMKNRLHATEEGYIDVRVIIKNPKNGAYSEILCLTPSMYEHKNAVPHKAYEAIRVMPENTEEEKKEKKAASTAIRGVYQFIQFQDAIKENGSPVKKIPEFLDKSEENLKNLQNPYNFAGLNMKEKTIRPADTIKNLST